MIHQSDAFTQDFTGEDNGDLLAFVPLPSKDITGTNSCDPWTVANLVYS
jgi:hypothetical protein